MEIRLLATSDFNTIFRAFSLAFGNYELQLNEVQLQAMLKRRGFDPTLSFAAFEGKEIVAFTLNGIGKFNGIFTAYDTGTGTLPDYRGKGLATQIFEYSIPYLRKRDVRQYLLEVLQHNTKAVSVYRKLGFNVVREFNYFNRKKEEISNEIKMSALNCSIQPIILKDSGSLPDFWDFYPSWQNSFESIQRTIQNFVFLRAFAEKRLIGYAVFEPVSGDITQLAMDKPYRQKGVASLLLQEMIRLNKNDSIKVINTDISCSSITGFLQAKNIELKGKQFEMIKEL